MERLTARITMRLITGDDRGRELEVGWTYRTCDPHAVRLDFGDLQPATGWLLSRDLLLAGLRAPVGERDVHIEPLDGSQVLIGLVGHGGIALLSAPAETVSGWLAATTLLVPPGTESTRLDWDRGLAELLAA